MKRRIQKKLALMTAGALALALLSGCGAGESGTDTNTSVSELILPAAEATATPAPSPAAAAENGQADKEETVYVKADASGNVLDITVETVLKNPGDGETIYDESNLLDIRNTEGDEEYTQEGSSLFWENHGEDISYKGTSGQALPVSLRISYTLGGRAVTPEELAGQSGKVTIRFDYENDLWQTVDINGVEEELCVPFLVLSAVVLSEENFSNIEVSSGKTLSMDGSAVVIGYACPGLGESLKLSDYEPAEEVEIPEYVEITADVVDFELELTATIITTGLLEDMEPEDLDDVDELIEDMEELTDASGDLVDGTGELYDGVKTLYSYITQYVSGVSSVSAGIQALAEGIAALDQQTELLSAGAASLRDGLTAISDTLAQIELPSVDEDAAAGAVEAVAALATDAQALSGQLAAMEETLSLAESVISEAESYEAAVAEAVLSANAALDSVAADATDTARQQARAAAEAALGNLELSEEDKQALIAAVAGSIDLSGQAGSVQAYISQAQAALSAIPALSLPDSLELDASAVSALVADMAVRLETVGAYAQSLAQELASAGSLESALMALKAGIEELAAGSQSLAGGVSAFSQGISQLDTGAAELYSGVGTLDTAGTSLSSGVWALVDGTKALQEGLETFDEEGIQSLADLAGDELSAIAQRLRALKTLEDGYQNFGGIAGGHTGSVRFIIETEAIEAE